MIYLFLIVHQYKNIINHNDSFAGLGLSNGTSVVFESLQLDRREDVDNIRTAITTAVEGEPIQLQYPPQFIIVSVPGVAVDDFAGRTLEPGRVLIPIPIYSVMEQAEIQLPGRPKKDTFSYRPHAVELKFAVTVNKVQGQTCDKVILQLNRRRFKPYVTFNMLVVSLSRVRKGLDIRLVPPQPGNASLDYCRVSSPAKIC